MCWTFVPALRFSTTAAAGSVICLIMHKYCCGNCEIVFGEHERICEDWRCKDKSIICPKCRHYLKVIEMSFPFEQECTWLFWTSSIFVLLGYLLEKLEYVKVVETWPYAIIFFICVISGIYMRSNSSARFRGDIQTVSLGKSSL